MTLLELIEAVSRRLDGAGLAYGHGTTNADDEAAWLVLWRLGLPLDALSDHAGDVVDAGDQATVNALVDERIGSRKPAAYLTGEAWLQGVPFFVDERVIVPRSLIAEPLMDGTLDVWLSEQTRSVLDLCTGNGSLAVLAAMAFPDAHITATDLSADALAVAASNVQRHHLQDRITLVQGDGLSATRKRYDLILCNPPYVNTASMQALPAEFRAEPALALHGGPDGMDFVRGLLRAAAQHLTEDGVLVLEIGHERLHFEQVFPRLLPVWLPTSAGDEQVLLLTREQMA
jgi:ribosomal protein L3 glutamine methyltransferase